jgi:hypothetical protein
MDWLSGFTVIFRQSRWKDNYGVRGVNNLHWVHAFGIVDNDQRPTTEIDELKAKDIYALSVNSVESIYYHPDIQKRVVEHHTINSTDASQLLGDAKTAALAAIRPCICTLSTRAAEKKS